MPFGNSGQEFSPLSLPFIAAKSRSHSTQHALR